MFPFDIFIQQTRNLCYDSPMNQQSPVARGLFVQDEDTGSSPLAPLGLHALRLRMKPSRVIQPVGISPLLLLLSFSDLFAVRKVTPSFPPCPRLIFPFRNMVVIIVVIWSLWIYRLEVPHSRGASPRLWIPLSNSRKTKGGRTTMTTDPCSQVWITMSGTTTKRRSRDYPIGSRDATPRRKPPLCAPFNDVSSLFHPSSLHPDLALFSAGLHFPSVWWLSVSSM